MLNTCRNIRYAYNSPHITLLDRNAVLLHSDEQSVVELETLFILQVVPHALRMCQCSCEPQNISESDYLK